MLEAFLKPTDKMWGEISPSLDDVHKRELVPVFSKPTKRGIKYEAIKAMRIRHRYSDFKYLKDEAYWRHLQQATFLTLCTPFATALDTVYNFDLMFVKSMLEPVRATREVYRFFLGLPFETPTPRFSQS